MPAVRITAWRSPSGRATFLRRTFSGVFDSLHLIATASTPCRIAHLFMSLTGAESITRYQRTPGIALVVSTWSVVIHVLVS